ITVWLVGCIVIKGAPGSVLIAVFISAWIWAGVSAWLYTRTSSIIPFKNRGVPPRVCPPKVRRLLESSPNKYSSSMVWLHLSMTEDMSALAATIFTQAENVAVVPGFNELEFATST